jgi:hypothetical protein
MIGKQDVHLPHGCGVALADRRPGFLILERMNSDTSAPFAPSDPPRSAGLAPKLALLLDVRFERSFSPLLVRWLYVGSLALICAVTLFGLLMSWWLASWAGWGFWMGVPISTAGGLVWALGARLVCERLIRWTEPEPRRSYTAAPSPGSSPAPSSHPPGSGPGSMGGGGAPRRKNDLRP